MLYIEKSLILPDMLMYGLLFVCLFYDEICHWTMVVDDCHSWHDNLISLLGMGF